MLGSREGHITTASNSDFSNTSTICRNRAPVLTRWLWNKYTIELYLLAAGYIFYISVKKLLVAEIEVVALENAYKIIDAEKALGLYWEATIQSWLLDKAEWLVIFFNWFYSLGFFPVLIPAAIVLFIARHRIYVFHRNIFLISYGVTWLLYVTFPATPPRFMANEGFIDSIEVMGPAFYNSKEAIALYNQYSAMPSMHFGWTLLFALIFIKSPYRPLKVFGVLYPTMSFWAIIITANHYFMDALVGGAIILASYLIYATLSHYPTINPIYRLSVLIPRAPNRRPPSATHQHH